jgi:hypothetical protein
MDPHPAFEASGTPLSTTNPYCEALGIQVPRLEVAKDNPDANYYALLVVALLERGKPITLEDAAKRFEEAGVAPAGRALASLKRCRPGRPPIYRDGDLYALDPYDDETDLWAFRLGLRPPRAPALRVIRPSPGRLPSPDKPLTVAQLDEAWREGRRGAQPMEPDIGRLGEVLAAGRCDSRARRRVVGTRRRARCRSVGEASGWGSHRHRATLGPYATRPGGPRSHP